MTLGQTATATERINLDSPTHVVGWGVVVAVAGAAAGFHPSVAVGVLGLVVGLATWRWPKPALHIGAVASLIARPSLDLFSERRWNVGPFTAEPAVVFGLGMLLVGIVLLLRRARDGRSTWPDGRILTAHIWLGLTYLILFVSGWRLYGSLGFGEGVRELARVGSIISAFLLVWWWVEGETNRLKQAWLCLALGAIPPVTLALWQLATGTGFQEPGGITRIQGTFSHPNSLGQFLAILALIVVAGIPAQKGWGRGWRAATAIGLSVLLALTYSRTAILVLATGLLTLLSLQSRFGWRTMIRGVVAAATFALLAWIVAGGLIRARFSGVSFRSAAWQEALAGESENSFQWRVINWSGLVLAGLDHPMTGHGAGMTTHLNPLVNSNNGVPFNAHDDFVRFFFEGGILGLMCYLIYGVLLCRWAISCSTELRRMGGTGSEALGLSAGMLAMIFLTGGTTELSLHTANLYTLYAVLALVAGMEKNASLTAHREEARRFASGQPHS